MWALVRELATGVTIILTTHYIDEAEEMADRIGVINKGELVVVEEKAALMKKLGKKQLTLHLLEPLTAIPTDLSGWPIRLKTMAASSNSPSKRAKSAPASPRCCAPLSELGIAYKDLQTRQSSLEDIFLDLVKRMNRHAVVAIYKFEMARFRARCGRVWRRAVITTAFYFCCVRCRHRRMHGHLEGVSYGAFIVPGLIMLAIFTESLQRLDFGIYLPSSPAQSTRCCRRRFPRSSWCSPTSARQRPSLCSSAL